MSRIIKACLLLMYVVVVVKYIRSIFMDHNIEIIKIEYITRISAKSIEQELKKHKRIMSVLVPRKRLKRLPTDYKYILKWTNAFSHYISPMYQNGQQAFIENNCPYKNCYLTNDKGLLADVVYFDAILFDVENNWDPHPIERSPEQYYVFVASESSDNFPVCLKRYDNYYNLTWSYKLNSDIRWSYISVFDKNGTFVGPKTDMVWVDPMNPTPDDVKEKIQTKNISAAWFVSHCKTKSARHKIANKLTKALNARGLDLHVYGLCGKYTCPKEQIGECLAILQERYFFFLAFENSMAEDYVTEKVLYALRYYTVPIVFGGANYSRFLPPGSYINAKEVDAETLAKQIHTAIENRDVYENYFRWHNHYTYKVVEPSSIVCDLCQAINQPPKYTAKTNFLHWWNDDYDKECGDDENKYAK